MDFKEFIAGSLKKDSELQNKIANAFEVANSTVERWATGASNPHPRVAKLVVRFVEGQLAELKIDFNEFIASSLKKSPEIKSMLVNHFKVSNFVVDCWAKGTVAPTHAVQSAVIDFVKQQSGE